MKRGINKPWLDHRGRHLPTEKLKEASKNWDAKTWLNYGDSLEVENEGILMSPQRLERVAAAQSRTLHDIYSEIRTSDQLTELVENLCKCLTPKQMQAVDLIFYEGRSLEEAGRILGQSKTAIYFLVQRAISKLRGAITVNVNDWVLMRGYENRNDDPLTPEEELLEVIKEETHTNNKRQTTVFERQK